MTHSLALRRLGSVAVRTPLAMPGERIGLMGGSFNPPHAAHLAVAETALRRLRLDRLWWLVTPGNPLKPTAGLAPLKKRVAAARALATDPRIVVAAFEAELGSAYTAATVTFLRTRFPRTHFVWVMGADNLAHFHRWRDWRHIADMIPIAVIDRPRWRLAAIASPAARTLASSRLAEPLAARLPFASAPAWVYLSTRLSSISSSEIRAKADAGSSKRR